MKTCIVPATPVLVEIERMFTAAGHELWFVGGCVRDALMGVSAKDVDLTTTATPDEQIAIYEANDVRYEPTGLKHGTITVIRNHEIYEITTMRTDVETDGRHAVVEYTRDLELDLQRRDLTFNAIAMSFDGSIVDPFDGRSDLAAGIVRFVGDGGLRIQEDYLRILRWFRFVGRFGGAKSVNREALRQIEAHRYGLSRISVERIWSEMARIITGPNAVEVMRMVHSSGVDDAIGMGMGYESRLEIAREHDMDAATTLGAYLADFLDEKHVDRVIVAWKLSNEEKHTARFVNQRILDGTYTTAAAKLDLVKGESLRLVVDTLRLARNAHAVAEIEAWTVPVFPVNGKKMIASGMKPGPEVGRRMRTMFDRWVASDFTLDAEALIEMEEA